MKQQSTRVKCKRQWIGGRNTTKPPPCSPLRSRYGGPCFTRMSSCNGRFQARIELSALKPTSNAALVRREAEYLLFDNVQTRLPACPTEESPTFLRLIGASLYLRVPRNKTTVGCARHHKAKLKGYREMPRQLGNLSSCRGQLFVHSCCCFFRS